MELKSVFFYARDHIRVIAPVHDLYLFTFAFQKDLRGYLKRRANILAHRGKKEGIFLNITRSTNYSKKNSIYYS